MENNDKTKQIINNLINRIVDIETTLNNVVQNRLDDIEAKIDAINSDMLNIKSTMIDLTNVVFPNPTAYTVKPIQEGYVSTVLEKIELLIELLESYFGGKEGMVFSSWYITVESIKNQITQTNQVSENQLQDLNRIFQQVNLKKKK